MCQSYRLHISCILMWENLSVLHSDRPTTSFRELMKSRLQDFPPTEYWFKNSRFLLIYYFALAFPEVTGVNKQSKCAQVINIKRIFCGEIAVDAVTGIRFCTVMSTARSLSVMWLSLFVMVAIKIYHWVALRSSPYQPSSNWSYTTHQLVSSKRRESAGSICHFLLSSLFWQTAPVLVQHARDMFEFIHSKNFLKMLNLEHRCFY